MLRPRLSFLGESMVEGVGEKNLKIFAQGGGKENEVGGPPQ